MSEIRIYSSEPVLRLEYVTGFLSDTLGISFVVMPNQSSPIPQSGDFFIHYGQQVVENSLNIYASGLLQETGIRQIEPGVVNHNDHTLLFPALDGFDMPFDIFSSVFYMISRYEEYLPFVPDLHGRFEAGQSLAFRNDFLEEPVVDQWLILFKTALLVKFPLLRFAKQEFRFCPTFDIDNPWAYKHKGLFRSVAGMLRHSLELDFQDVRRRIAVLVGAMPDPFDTYDYIRQTETRYGFRSIFFFLSGNYGRYDDNYALNTRHFRKLLQTIGAERLTGIHPSYKSNSHPGLLQYEFEHFTRIMGKKPIISRQHFLLLSLPKTYRRLASLGITMDYSMGYASMPGFRAGTSLPFKFFDLHAEKELPLLIHPFVIMDVTLKQYLHIDPEAASAEIKFLIRKIKDVDGIFTPLWHNESLSDMGIWKGWRNVFENMMKEAKAEGRKEKREGRNEKGEERRE